MDTTLVAESFLRGLVETCETNTPFVNNDKCVRCIFKNVNLSLDESKDYVTRLNASQVLADVSRSTEAVAEREHSNIGYRV